jgi:hypothetical protein
MAALIGSIQVRKDTAANWTASNPTLLSGEIGLETDTRRVKIGDGATLWNALAYSLNPLGVAASTDVLRRSDGDARYDAIGAAAAALVSANAYTDASVVGLFDDRGNWDASGNLFPATGGSGTAGAILKGDVWRVSVAGTLGGEVADVGDSFRALVDTPGQTASNWALFAANTQQATESVRGTLAVASNAEAIDQASTNDIDAVTPVKWWAAFTSGVTFATAPAALLTSIRSTLLTGISFATSTAITATDSILAAFGKLQAFNNLFTTIGLAYARLTNPSAVTFPRQNADNTVTSRTAAELLADLGLGPTLLSVAGPLSTTSASLANVTGAVFNSVPVGMLEVQFMIDYDASATTVGAYFSIDGTATQNYLGVNVLYNTSTGDNPSRSSVAFNSGGTATSSRATTGNVATVNVRINVTVTGTIQLRFATEAAGNAITIQSVTGFLTKVG